MDIDNEELHSAENQTGTILEKPEYRFELYKHGIKSPDKYGWTWIAKVKHSLNAWTRLYFYTASVNKNFFPQELCGMKQIGSVHGAGVTWRIVSEPAGPGYFIVGQAAYILDPSSSLGILKAIMSGIMAGHLIIKTIKNSELRGVVIREYSKWITHWFMYDIFRLKEIYRRLPCPPKWIA